MLSGVICGWLFLCTRILAIPSFGPSYSISIEQAKYTDPNQPFDYVNIHAPKDGFLRLASEGNYNTLNPFTLNGMPASGIELTYETLGRNAYDQADTVYALVAESFTYDKKLGSMRVKLRDNVRFHNQTLVEAEDIIATFNTLTTKGHPAYQQYYQSVASVTAIDKRTLIFKEKKPGEDKDFPFKIAGLPVLSAADLKQRDFDQTTMTPLQGTGAYRLDKSQPGQKIAYTRNPDYWGKNLGMNQGRNNFKKITYYYFKDSHIALTAFKAHRYDWRVENIAKFWTTQYKGDALKSGSLKQLNIPSKRPIGMQAFAMNTRKTLFEDIKVRRALDLAFDFDWMNANLFYQSYSRNASFYTNSRYQFSVPLDSQATSILKLTNTPESLSQPAAPNQSKMQAKLEQAQQLLNESDWQLIGQQRYHKKSQQPLQFTLLINSKAMERVALPYKEQLEKLGIDMRIQLVSPSDWVARVQSFDYDMTTYYWPAPSNPGVEQVMYWHSQYAFIPGSQNVMGIRNQNLDELSESIAKTDDPDLLTIQMQALDRILMTNHYVIPHWHIDYERVAYWTCLSPPPILPAYGVDITSWYQVSPCNEVK